MKKQDVDLLVKYLNLQEENSKVELASYVTLLYRLIEELAGYMMIGSGSYNQIFKRALKKTDIRDVLVEAETINRLEKERMWGVRLTEKEEGKLNKFLKREKEPTLSKQELEQYREQVNLPNT